MESQAPHLDSYLASTYFSELFPEAIVIPASAEQHGDGINNLRRYGIGVAELCLPDGSIHLATYIHNRTRFTDALGLIHGYEFIDGMLPEGSHCQAIEDMEHGVFEENWAGFIPPGSL